MLNILLFVVEQWRGLLAISSWGSHVHLAVKSFAQVNRAASLSLALYVAWSTLDQRLVRYFTICGVFAVILSRSAVRFVLRADFFVRLFLIGLLIGSRPRHLPLLFALGAIYVTIMLWFYCL